jgi:hypothetical protein
MQPHKPIIRRRTVFARLLLGIRCFNVSKMTTHAPVIIAVIFVAQRTAVDVDGYAKASATMKCLAQEQLDWSKDV